MKKILLILILIIPTSIIFTQKTEASVIEKTYNRSYMVSDDFVQVNEYKEIKVVEQNWFIPSGSSEVFTIFYPITNDPSSNEKIQKTLDSIKVTDSVGNDLYYTSEKTDSGNLLINVPIYTRINYGQSYRIYLSYNSYGLLVKNGNVRDVYVPSFPKDYETNSGNINERIFTNINIPKKFGEINFSAPAVEFIDNNEYLTSNIDKEKLIGQTLWIQVGTTQYYQFEIKQPYKKTSNLSIYNNTYEIPIPRDVFAGPITQKVYYTNISPKPESVVLDLDGNLIATFKPKANLDGFIEISGFAVLTQNNSINFKASGDLSDIPQDILDRNTAPALYWESRSPEIVQTAMDLKGDETNVYNLISKTYEYVIGKIDYSTVKRFGINERQGALKTLKGGAAVCMEYSDLFIALMRSQGVPARAAYGYGYSALDYETSSSQTINHQWAEVYIPSIASWINVDTTWGENGEALIGGDLNHFYSHVTSIDPETPSTAEVKYFGELDEIPEREMTVEALETVSLENANTQEQLLVLYPKKEDAWIEALDEIVKVIEKNTKIGTLLISLFCGIGQVPSKLE